jgi:CubicO group peptidase (beta-lactamase class C family)
MKRGLRAFVVIVLVGYASYTTFAQQRPAGQIRPAAPPAAAATPESVGISTERLARLHQGMQGFVDRREVAGIVTLVARDGKTVDQHATGFQDLEQRTPMRTDTIFRIASMTKPVTSVAVMMLYEEGKLQLTDSVARFIPAFKGQRVVGENGATVAARREINIRDLLSHRSGLSYGFLNAGPVGDAYRKEGVLDGLAVMPMSLEEAINKLAAQPLLAQPGAAWNYSLSTDVLGRVVEVASGQPFNVFLQERLFKPLGMTETSFDLPESKISRFATVYSPDGANGIRPMKDPETFGNTIMSPVESYKAPKKYFSGGAGLVSTAADYAKFANMLLGGGTLGSARILSPKTIELMTVSHTTDLPAGGGLLGPGTGFGLGFRVVTDLGPTQTLGSEGLYGWSGIYGTTFWVDPKEHLVAILMVQRYPGSPVANLFQPLVYQALTKSHSATTN